MIYENITGGIFISRPNRFIAICSINGKEETVHVKNTGRCRELLVPGARVILEISSNPNRKTKYDLIAVYKGDLLINMDSQCPNKAVFEWLCAGGLVKNPDKVVPEKVFGKSRLDFYLEKDSKKIYAEVKGVTLESNKVASFPDAPTTRGTKHLNELISAVNNGFDAYVIFVLQMKGCRLFTPNYATDSDFANTLKKAYNCGVKVLALDCVVTENSVKIDSPVEICLDKIDK